MKKDLYSNPQGYVVKWFVCFFLLLFSITFPLRLKANPLRGIITSVAKKKERPISNKRFFAPLRLIPVAPIGIGMLSVRGLNILLFEALLFSPLFVFAVWPWISKLIILPII